MYLFRLIRWPNLLIVFLTQYLLYEFILVTQLKKAGLSPTLDGLDFFALTLATILTAAAGYVINDIYDQVIDALNKPDRMIVGKLLSEKAAYLWYGGFVMGGAICIGWLTYRTGAWFWIPGYILANAMMYWYSRSWKKKVLIGNFVVALFCGLVAVVVIVGESGYWPALMEKSPAAYLKIVGIFSAYSVFAFLSTMYREIVKDMEDVYGDEVDNCRTLPIVLGIQKAKTVAAFFAISLLLSTIFWSYLSFVQHQYPQLVYLLVGIVVPIKGSLLLLGKAETVKAFHQLSTLTKLIMLSGILYLGLEVLCG